MSVLTIEEVCAALKMSRRGLHRHRAKLEAAGVLVEALPRLDGRPRYLAQPVQDYTSGRTRQQAVRTHLREAASWR